MPFTEFYIQTTGNNLNAGSDTNDAASITETGGTISTTTTTTTFTAASGTPFSSVSVGQYISLANNVTSGAADTVARFVVPVLTVVGGGSAITFYNDTATGANRVSFGAISGVSTTAAAVDCRVGGAWASLVIHNSGGALATPTATNNIYPRINIKSGTYANGTTVITMATTSVFPIAMRGYDVTPGDLDNLANTIGTTNSGTAINRPKITFSGTGQLIAYNTYLSNLDFSGNGISNTVGTVHQSTGTTILCLIRCRIKSTTYAAVSCASGTLQLLGCFIQGGTNASCTAVYQLSTSLRCFVYGCTIFKCTNGVIFNSSSLIAASVFVSQTSVGASAGDYSTTIINNTFYSCATGITGSGQINANNVIANSTAYGINPGASTSYWYWDFINNAFWSNASGQFANLFESYLRGSITETASPFVSPTAYNLNLKTTALSAFGGFPGQLEVYTPPIAQAIGSSTANAISSN